MPLLNLNELGEKSSQGTIIFGEVVNKQLQFVIFNP